MSTADLAAIRALMEAVECRRATTAALSVHYVACGECRTGQATARPCGAAEMYAELRASVTRIATALPTAWVMLERMEQDLNQLAREVGYWRPRAENAEIGEVEGRARIERLEKALRRVRVLISPATVGQHECDILDAAVEGQ